jgi:hypothetical protein
VPFSSDFYRKFILFLFRFYFTVWCSISIQAMAILRDTARVCLLFTVFRRTERAVGHLTRIELAGLEGEEGDMMTEVK